MLQRVLNNGRCYPIYSISERCRVMISTKRSLVSSKKSGTHKSSRKNAMKRQQQASQEMMGSTTTQSTTANPSSWKESSEVPISSSQLSSTFSSESPIIHQQPHIPLDWNLNPPTWESSIGTSNTTLSTSPLDHEISFDAETMFDPAVHLPYAPQDDWSGYEPATPLFDFLMQRIGVTGQPITTAEYMRHALTHPLHGYYTNPPETSSSSAPDDDDDWDDIMEDSAATAIPSLNDSTLIGPRGDFITAPEISHVFGHCICVWMVAQWQSMNEPERIDLVELGPGRGTLMADIVQLAVSSKLQDFGNAIGTIHLIETSPELRKQQQQALRKSLGEKVHLEFGTGSPPNDDDDDETISPTHTIDTQKVSIRVQWHDAFSAFEAKQQTDIPVMIIAQEFFDALPVHSFQMTSDGWRERMIDVASVDHKAPEALDVKLLPRLRQVLAPDTTPATDLLLSSTDYGSVQEGGVVEICPEAVLLVQDMTKVLEQSGGNALIFDYGHYGTSDSLRAFSKHKQVPLTSRPGEVDITADVDFYALHKSVDSKKTPITAFGPVTQGEFLMRMGAAEMVIKSIESDDTTVEQANKLTDALKYLVMPEHMGEKFKVLALGEKRDGIFAPPGMEK